MATNLNLDVKLVEAARNLGRHKTKREAVNRALHEYVGWLRQQAILDQFGTIQYDPKYDHRKQRKLFPLLPEEGCLGSRRGGGSLPEEG